jgi:hypothetical protein
MMYNVQTGKLLITELDTIFGLVEKVVGDG